MTRLRISSPQKANRSRFNFDEWFINAFAYRIPVEDAMRDLGRFEVSSEGFVLRGTDDVQQAMMKVRQMEHKERGPFSDRDGVR